MSGDFSSHDLPHAHCMNSLCPEFNRKKLLPSQTHRPSPEHHVQPAGTLLQTPATALEPPSEALGDQE